MEPLNKAERKKAFINFVIFFSITTILVIAAVLFSVEVPFKQNEQLRSQMNFVEKDRDFAERFVSKMGETINLLDSVNKSDVRSPEIVENKIKDNENAMREMIENNNDSISQKSLYRYIVNTFSELRIAKKDLRNVSGKDANLTELQKQNSELRNNYQQALDRYSQLQQMVISMQRQ